MASTPDNLYVTYVDMDRDLLKIWGQRNRIGATYIKRQLLQLVPEFNRIPCPNPTQIHKGMFCFAKYTDDNYYRARVLSRVQNDSVSVHLVDYGNRDVIKLSNIRIQEGKEGDVLSKMSEQAEDFYLARVASPPTGWTKEIISEIRRDICHEEFLYQITTQIGDQKILEIQFRNEDFSNYLIKKQLASPLSLPAQRHMVLSYCSLVPSEMKPESQLKDMQRLTYSPSVPPPNMRATYRPANIPNEAMMQLNYGKTNSPMNFQPPQALHPSHQAHTVQLPSPRQINSKLQHMNQSTTKNQYFPPMNYSSNPIQVNVSSTQMDPVSNPLLNNGFNPLHVVKECTDPFNGNKNIIQILAQQVKQYIAEDNAKTESEAERIPHHYVNIVLEVGNMYNVIISYIDDGPWSFSVQLPSSETELQKLMDELSTVELVPLKPPIILGHPCIASSALYGNLCRGVIVSISHSAVKVYFVDFGNTEDLPSSSIYELPPKFFKIHVLSQKFCLSGLQKVVYSDDIKKFFREVVQDVLLTLRVTSLEGDNLPSCELYHKDINIKRILNEKIRELRNSSMEDFPKVGETENVIVTWVISPQKFFVQLHKRDADLNALKKELAEVETKGQPLTYQQLSVGFKCVCLYESDGQWYRAVITSVDSENAITVFYVDYGNTETVSVKSLRRIASSSLINQMSNQAIQCSLKGFENKPFDKELANKLEALVLEKDIQMTVVSSENKLLCVELLDDGKDISSVLLNFSPPKLESLDTSSASPFSVDSIGAGSFGKGRKFEAADPQDKNGSSFRGEKARQKNVSGRPSNYFQTFKSPIHSTPAKSKRRFEDNGKSENENHWNEPKPDEQTRKIRGFNQGRETDIWDNNNNNNNNNNKSSSTYSNINISGNINIGSKSGGPRNSEKGRDDRIESAKFERSRGFKQERSRDDWNERKESNFGEKKRFDENRGRERGNVDERRFGTGGGKPRERFDRSRGRDENAKRSERNENAFFGRERNVEERKSSRIPIRKEDIAPPGSKFEDRVIQLGSSENGIVTYYFSPHEFFVQLLAQEKDFKKMMTDIQTYYSDKYSVRDPVQAGDIVIAQFSLDKVLYRAEVIKPSPVTVRYVDYGNQEPVGPKSTWFVDKKFLTLPKQVIKCRLSNVEPMGLNWPPPSSGIDKFFEFAKYKCTFLGVEGDIYEISLEDVGTGKDIASELIAAGHARSPAPKLEIPEIDYSLLPSQILRLYVSHIESSTEFYVILNPNGLKMIEEGLKMFADDKKNLIPISGALIKPGMACLSTGDDLTWHRGNVIKTDGNKILVRFSDRGNIVEVTEDKVMSLPDHLKVFQPQAVLCSLHGTSGIENEEEFKVAVEFKHHLVAFVSEMDKSMSVVLYNEDGQKFEFQKCDDFPLQVEPIGQLPIISQKVPVLISHVESPHEIYVHWPEDEENLINLSEQISDFYSEEKEYLDIEEEEDIEGVLVAAKSAVYETWYRGRLLSSTEEGCEIFYIDYGNKEILPRGNVKKLEPSFLNLNAFTKKLALDVEKSDSEKTEEISNKIFELCQYKDKDILAYFRNVGGEFFTEITISGERITRMLELVDSSVSDKFAHILSGEKTVTKTQSTASTAQEPSIAENIPEPDDLKVFVSHIDSPNRFWVYKESMSNELHKFQDKLQKSCEILADKKDVQVGDVVAAVYTDNWYRAKVTNVDGDNTTVQFIDYGNSLNVDLSCNTVKELTEEFLRVPVFATPFALVGNWSNDSTSKFEEIILQSDEPVRVVVLEESDPVVVDLYQNERSIAEMLAERIREEEEEEEEEREDLCAVYISHFQSPNDFYIQRENCEDTFKELTERLLDPSAFETPSSIKENEMYAAKFPDDGAWYRAKVIKIQGDEVEVHFIDYGNTSNVAEVKCLPEDLVDIPNLAENYSLLYGENCDSWSPAAFDKFAELADGRKLEMKVVVKRVKKPIVELFDNGKNVREELETLCENDGRSKVFVTYAVSPLDFYIQYVDDENYKLIEASLAKGDEGEELEDVQPGTLCQARFEDDGYWYRAKILEKVDEGFEVFFIDFGNTSVATQLKKLPDNIKEIPPRALRCMLNLPETNIPESVKEEFINLTMESSRVFRALVIVSNEINTVSLKLGGRILEETLNLDISAEKSGFLSDSLNHERFPHSVDSETDDGKNSKKNLISEDYLISNLADDLRSGGSDSNETDEEKRVKKAISGIEGSEGFKSDDEKGFEGTSPAGFVNATDNELMEEVWESGERGNASDVSGETGEVPNEEEEQEYDNEKEEEEYDEAGEVASRQETSSELDQYETSGDGTETVAIDVRKTEKIESIEVESENKRTESKVDKDNKIVPGSVSRGEEEVLTETSQTQYQKLTFSEKLIPGSVSRGVSLDPVKSEKAASEEPKHGQTAANTPKSTGGNDSNNYVKIDPNDRLVPGCISTGISLHCNPTVEKIPAGDKIVPGAVNGSVKDN